jgi:hypothetical protein
VGLRCVAAARCVRACAVRQATHKGAKVWTCCHHQAPPSRPSTHRQLRAQLKQYVNFPLVLGEARADVALKQQRSTLQGGVVDDDGAGGWGVE